MAKSYYAILGISSMATADEVRAAYRRLVKAYHPDHYHGGSENFRQVQEAYSILGNPERRRQYERQLHKPPMPGYSTPDAPRAEPLIPDPEPMPVKPINPMDSFQWYGPSTDSLFDMVRDSFSGLLSSQSGRVRVLTIEIPVAQAQARRGGTVTVSVPARARCPACKGYGREGIYVCRGCAGEGAITGEMPVAISFPPDIPDNYEVIIPLARYGIRNHQASVIFRLVGKGNPIRGVSV